MFESRKQFSIYFRFCLNENETSFFFVCSGLEKTVQFVFVITGAIATVIFATLAGFVATG